MNEAWMKKEAPPDLTLTAEQVLALPIGSRVCINGQNKSGEYQQTLCIVAGHPDRKFLTYRAEGLVKRCRIEDYPGKYYTKVVEK